VGAVVIGTDALSVARSMLKSPWPTVWLLPRRIGGGARTGRVLVDRDDGTPRSSLSSALVGGAGSGELSDGAERFTDLDEASREGASGICVAGVEQFTERLPESGGELLCSTGGAPESVRAHR
jgi:hypothetical protein